MKALSAPSSVLKVPRTVRRVLVVIAYAIPLFVFGTGRYEGAAFGVWHLLLGVSLCIFFFLVGFYGHALGLSRWRFDERQRELYYQTTALAYPFIAAPLVLAVLLHAGGSADTPLFNFFFFASFYVTGFAPASIVAWLEPDPVPETERGLREA